MRQIAQDRRSRHALDDLADLAQRLGGWTSARDQLAGAAVAPETGEARDDQVAHSGKAGEGLGLRTARLPEAGHLDETLVATSRDEIGHLTTAFNSMVEQLRLKERIRETFGKYIDPRVVEGLIDRPELASEAQRRVMTVLFCDVKGFTSTSEGMTPQGLVKVMNRYFSVMSAPIRDHEGIIDKYIGDAIMAYWGPPFADDAA